MKRNKKIKSIINPNTLAVNTFSIFYASFLPFFVESHTKNPAKILFLLILYQ
jgi:hypothetical protein